jgi:hypothetical protein
VVATLERGSQMVEHTQQTLYARASNLREAATSRGGFVSDTVQWLWPSEPEVSHHQSKDSHSN